MCVTNGVTPIRPVRYPSQRYGPVPGQGDFGALSAVREEQPEVKPYCACESCACCGSVAVEAWLCVVEASGPGRAGRAIAGPGAGRCEGRAEPFLAGGVRAAPGGCVRSNLRWSRIAPANPVRAVEAWL